ncbi:MAG TPA: hypothetical protein VFO20_10820 [Propionibacteriaceae bacterium]|nr:hypothetical protein [Propionibacteriaceae bacterium]
MIIGPLVDELGRASSYDTRARRLFVNQLSGRPGRVEEFPVGCNEPIVQPLAIVAEGVIEVIVRAGDAPVEGHRHLKH